ncbi:hypothetical protein PLESTF_001903300 [Pleodorina starrii]|nr:hypothetical protein PLESTM_001893900 [Pleodorina starrii]GLC77243.1 hypothetical protein PLESTF_001903300 [Pleodorina starrii]
MSGPLQVEFFFSGPPLNADAGADTRQDYVGFNLNGVEYRIGDCAFLYPEDEGVPPYVGRILKCFHDRSGAAADPHCVEVAWFERRAHLEPDPLGGNWEREVVALEETDVNPIGCISGKAVVFRAGDYQEACRMAQSLAVEDWLYCRGVYKQSENCVVPFPEMAEHIDASEGKRHGKRSQVGVSGQDEGVADSDEVKRQRFAEEQPVAPLRRTGKLVSGRTCVECGATQTPQWREGPAGPKTLCNACGVRYVRAQQRANKRAVAVGAARAGYGAGGRQSRNSKAAKAEAASARAARAAAAAAAVATEEAPQRPTRQAALMAASRTAQYARTGVFPVDAMELIQPPPLDSANGHSAMQQQQQLDQRLQHQDADVSGMAAATATGSIARPGTPNCSSYDSCGSIHEGVTVEVVVGPADGDAECCGGGGEAAAAAAAAAAQPYPLLASSAVPLLQPPQFGGALGAMIPADQSVMALAPVLVMGGDALPGGSSVPQLPVSATMAGGVLGVSAGLVGSGANGTGIFFAAAPDAGFGAEHGCFATGPQLQQQNQQQQQLCSQSAVEAGAPALSGGCCDAAMAGCAGGGSGGGGLSGVVESSAAQVISAPVSPSVRGGGGGGFGCCDFGCGDVGLDGDLRLRGYPNQLACGLDVGLDDEYGPLVEVEVDFGLGPASAMDDGCLFGEFHHGGVLGCEDDDLPFQQPPEPEPYNHHHHHQQQQSPEAKHEQPPPQQQDSDGGVEGPEDLPAVAACVSPFCPELAPGTHAREVLDSLPMLVQTCMVPQGGGTATAGVGLAGASGDVAATQAVPAAAAAGGSAAVGGAGQPGGAALPGEAVARLVALGRQASIAATEARAADAALQAVSQVLEAHQEAARKAREAAAANLGRLKDRISTLTGGDPLTVAEMGGHLIDLQDLVAAGGGGGGGGLLVGGMAAGGCCCPFDAADMGVAVHS